MSEMLKVSIKRLDSSSSLIVKVIDIHPDVYNSQAVEDDREDYETGVGISPFMMGTLLEAADGDHGEMPEFIKEFKRAEHLFDNGNLDDFVEDDEYNYCDIYSVTEEELLAQFIESSQIIELCTNDFWESWDGADYKDEELPYVAIKVSLKNEEWAELFDGIEYETAFEITI